MAQVRYGRGRSATLGVPAVTQRGIGTLVKRQSSQRTSKGEKTYSKYWIYVPTDVAEDKAFPFKAGDKLLITITDAKRVFLERA